MGVRPAQSIHPLGIPQKQFISPQKCGAEGLNIYICLL